MGPAGAAPADTILSAAGNLSGFNTAIDLTTLHDYVQPTGPVTIFAPVDAAVTGLENQFPMDNEIGARRALPDGIVAGKLSLGDLESVTSVAWTTSCSRHPIPR